MNLITEFPDRKEKTMAIEHSLSVNGQPYFGSSVKRTIPILYTEPSSGIDKATGILLLIAGFDGDTSSKVYRKIRHEFADTQNLIIVQCNYFGSQFMGSKTMSEVYYIMNEMSQKLLKYSEEGISPLPKMNADLNLQESSDCFCELGIFQALDNLKAIKKVIESLKEQNIKFNYDRIIAYGYSHGAYLALICNALMPNLFSAIVDNSGWLYPVYLYRPRLCTGEFLGQTLIVSISYQGRKWIKDLGIYNLNRLYSQLDNSATIIAYHGESDGLISYNEKQRFISKIKNAKIFLVTQEEIDGKIFKNTLHGMGSDFLKFFYYVSQNENLSRPSCENSSLETLFLPGNITSKKFQYNITNELDILIS